MGRGRNDYRNYQNQNYKNFYYEGASDFNLFYGKLLMGVMEPLVKYTWEIEEKIHKSAKRLQTQMFNEIISVSPIRKYTPKHSRITDREEAGYFRRGWKRYTMRIEAWDSSDFITVSRGLGKRKFGVDHIYAVRNINEPMLVHLLNFDHDTVAHGVRYQNASKGTHFADQVQSKYQEKFNKEVKRILNE